MEPARVGPADGDLASQLRIGNDSDRHEGLETCDTADWKVGGTGTRGSSSLPDARSSGI